MPLVATSRMTGRMRSGQLATGAGGARFMSASWTSGRARASVDHEGSRVEASERQIIEDRAVRTVVAMAAGDQTSKRAGHGLHFGDPRLKVADMGFRNAPDVTARAAAVAP